VCRFPFPAACAIDAVLSRKKQLRQGEYLSEKIIKLVVIIAKNISYAYYISVISSRKIGPEAGEKKIANCWIRSSGSVKFSKEDSFDRARLMTYIDINMQS